MKKKYSILFRLLTLIHLLQCTAALPKWLDRMRSKKRAVDEAPALPPTLTEQLFSLPWYIWWITFLVLSTLLVVLYFLYLVGALDRPSFIVRDAVVWSSNHTYWQQHDKRTEYLYAIMAVSHQREYGQAIQRLLPATSKAVGASVPAQAPPAAAALYGAPTGSDSLSVALYFDDPAVVRQPRWAIGWLVAAATHKQAQEWAEAAKSAWNEDEPLVAVRIGSGSVLNARVPWRHVLTPAIAPYLHWSRGFAVYGSLFPDRPSPVAAEFYITGENQSREWIDYTIFLDDIAHTWQDCGLE